MMTVDSFQPQPFQLYNKVQHYDWGTQNEEAYIPAFLGEVPEKDKPYAELWVGTHPKMSSELDFRGQRISLRECIFRYPQEMLGKEVATKFNNNLPYLFKVLSARKALSIQTHPNKEQAVKLHAFDPLNYPDDNHKPEIAVAVDSLATLCGFLPVKVIHQNLTIYPEIREFAGCVEAASPADVYRAIMLNHGKITELAAVLESLRSKILQKDAPTAAEKEFLKQYVIFGTDIGLLSFFFFNFVELREGQGVFTSAGVPHAYIKGNIIECMANSDNVVRAGLTNKFTDVKTLLDILQFDFAPVKILQPDGKNVKSYYNPGIDEFAIVRIASPGSYQESFASEDRPRLIAIMDGSLDVSYGDTRLNFHRGDIVFLPAALRTFTLASPSAVKAFIVEIP